MDATVIKVLISYKETLLIVGGTTITCIDYVWAK
jgi:hypothetical protein